MNEVRVFKLSGETSVTSIPTSNLEFGDVLVLIATGVKQSVLSGNNLKLERSWYSGVVGDTLTLISDGVNWNELSRKEPKSRLEEARLAWGIQHEGNAPIAETTIMREFSDAATVAAPVSGRLEFFGVHLRKDDPINYVQFVAGSTAAKGLTNQWAALYTHSSTGPEKLAVSEDRTTTAIGANGLIPFKFASTYTTPSTGRFFIGLCIVATETMPTLYGVNTPTSQGGKAPIRNGIADTGLTTPATAPSKAKAPENRSGIAYAGVFEK